MASPTSELFVERTQYRRTDRRLRPGRNQIDLGFTFGRAIPVGLEGFRYHSEPFVARLPNGHRYAPEKRIGLSKLENEEFVFFARIISPDHHQAIVAACLAVGFTPKIGHEVRHWMSVVSFVAHGIGVSLVPASLAKSNVSNIFFVPLCDARLYSETWCV